MIFHSKKFRQIRKKKRWSLSALAVRSGISRRSLSDWENNKRIPAEKSIVKLAKALEIEVSEISDVQKELSVSELNLNEHIESCMSMVSPLGSYVDEFENFQTVLDLIHTRIENNAVLTNAILSAIDTPLYLKDIRQRYILVNNAFMNSIGFDISMFSIGCSDDAFFARDEAKQNFLEDEQVIKYGRKVKDLKRYIPGTRKAQVGLVSKYPVFDNQKKICGVIGIFSDIKNTSDNFQKLSNFNTLLSCLSDAVFYGYVDKNGRINCITYVNDSFADLTGIIPEEFKKNINKLRNIIVPEDLDSFDIFINTTITMAKDTFKVVNAEDGEVLILKIKTLLKEKFRFFILSKID